MGPHHASEKKGQPVSLQQLAEICGGRLDGAAGQFIIHGIAPISEARPGEVTFLTDVKQPKKHLEELASSKASAVIASEKLMEALSLPCIRVANPYVALAAVLRYFHPNEAHYQGIHPTAFVHEDAEVDPTASIGPLTVVEAGAKIGPRARIDGQAFIGFGVTVGSGAHLHPGVIIKDGCRIGERTIVQSGAVIGSDGFGFQRVPEGHLKIPQVGIVEIGADVEIGANVTVDRATMGSTAIGDGTKIDNLGHIAHNVKIGKNCLIVAQVGISGSTILEDDVTLAGQVGTAGHVRVGRGTVVAARGVVTSDVEPNSFVSGFPLKPHQEERKIMAALRKLPDLIKTVRELKEIIEKKD